MSTIDNQASFNAFINENIYTIELDNVSSNELICLAAINEYSWLWHRRFRHANMNLHSNLSKHELVKGLLDTKLVKDKVCKACQLLNMDLFDFIRNASLSGKLYTFVNVDDYSRYT
jgi:hypothetical protein